MANFSIEPNPDVTFRVCYEDEHVMVVLKPPHTVTQPGKAHERTSLMNGLFAKAGPKLQQLGRERDFGLLHRLDRETSGLVIIGLTQDGYDGMRRVFENRELAKFYWAITVRAPEPSTGVIKRPIAEYDGKGRDDGKPKKLARLSSAGKMAVTAYRVLSQSGLGAVVECRAVTGRLHQLRVHLTSIKCPIVGDDEYGPKGVKDLAPRLALHAHRVVFPHPITGEQVDVSVAFPKDLLGVLRQFRLQRPDGVELIDRKKKAVKPLESDDSHEFGGDEVGDQET